jgi:signal transduction histidine kinase
VTAGPPSAGEPPGLAEDGVGLGLLCRALKLLHQGHTPSEVPPRLLDCARQALGVTAVLLLSLNADGRTVRVRRAAGDDPELGAGGSGQGLGGSQVCPSLLGAAAPTAPARRLGVSCAPAGANPTLVVAWLPPGAAWTPGSSATMRLLAQHAAVALHNAELHATADAAVRVRAEFLATMSHELRTPLNAIVGFAELLSQGALGPLNDSQREALEGVLKAAHETLTLLDRALVQAPSSTGLPPSRTLH